MEYATFYRTIANRRVVHFLSGRRTGRTRRRFCFCTGFRLHRGCSNLSSRDFRIVTISSRPITRASDTAHWPDPKKFAYTFDHYAEIISRFTETLGLSATRCTCRIMAARSVFVWPWRIRTGSKPSSCRMRWRTTKAWERTGRRGVPFGPIAPPMKTRCAQILLSLADDADAPHRNDPMWNAMTRISGPMNLIFSTSLARPRYKAISSTTTARTSMPTLKWQAWYAREAASPSGDLGEV